MVYQNDPEIFDQSLFLYRQGKFQEAYDLLTNSADQFPWHAQRIFEWRMDIAARMGQLDLAESILENALNAGCFFGEFALRKDDDLKELQRRPKFENLVKRNFSILADAQRTSKPRLEIFNEGRVEKATLPLLLAFHGNNSNVSSFRPYWQSLKGSDWLVALPQSSQLSGKGVYAWNDMTLVEKEVCEHYRQILGAYPIDPKRIVVAGFSKGGFTAIKTVINDWVRATGFIAIAPYIADPEDLLNSLDDDLSDHGKGVFLLGEDDHECTPGARILLEGLNQRGMMCKSWLFPGLRHNFPDNFDRILQECLNYMVVH